MSRPAAVSTGRRRTVCDTTGPLFLEAHLLGVDELDLNGRELRVQLFTLLRPQRRFVGVDDLTRQLTEDVAAERGWARPLVSSDAR